MGKIQGTGEIPELEGIQVAEGTQDVEGTQNVEGSNKMALFGLPFQVVEGTVGMVGLLVSSIYQLVYIQGFQNRSS